MTDKDIIHERGRSLEDDYFRKKDRELVEKIQRAADAERARADISKAAGLSDPALADELLALGFTAETVALLPVVPIVQVAWAEGGVSPAERDLIVRFARGRGIAEGSPADAQLSAWLSARPSEEVFERAGRLIRAMLESGAAGDSEPR